MKGLILPALIASLAANPAASSLERRSSERAIGLRNYRNMKYVVNIAVHDVDMTVALDTGSSDLWIKPDWGLPQFQNTSISVSLTYKDGSGGVRGVVGVAPVLLRDKDGRLRVEKQAFIAAAASTHRVSTIKGIYGILGLGPESNSVVQVMAQAQREQGHAVVDGEPFVQNLVKQRPASSQFFALELLRKGPALFPETLQDDGGSLWVAEHDPAYLPFLASAPKLPLYPADSFHYATLLEGLSVGGKAVQLSSVGYPNAPANHAVTTLESGLSEMFLPASISAEYHSKIPGAAKWLRGLWLVPCQMPVVTLQFGGQQFPFHPYDLIGEPKQVVLPDGIVARVCYSAFKDQVQYQQRKGSPDVWLGTPFLQNVYSVFQTGNERFIQLISTTTRDVAASQPQMWFQGHRELPPTEVVSLVDLESLWEAMFERDGGAVLPKHWQKEYYPERGVRGV